MLGGGFEMRAVDAARSLLALHQHLTLRARPLAVGARSPRLPTPYSKVLNLLALHQHLTPSSRLLAISTLPTPSLPS